MSSAEQRAQVAQSLKQEAALLLHRSGLFRLLEERFGKVRIAGSAGYDLMVRRDIDIHVPVELSAWAEWAYLLAEIARPLPVCADESCFYAASLPALKGKYDMVNLKLDKTGGLTEALRTRDEAARLGFGLMVGCMVGSSLAMAPAVLVAQTADETDLDGPLLLAQDRDHPLRYDAHGVHPSTPELWG